MSICDLDSDAGEMTANELSNMFGKHRIIFCHCDVTDYSQFEGKEKVKRIEWKINFLRKKTFSEAFQTTKDTFGFIDIVVNNAEIMNDKFWELEVDVNLVSRKKLIRFF